MHHAVLGVSVDHDQHTFSCLHSEVMGKLLAKSGPFLFPCTIEYSLICAAVLYMMWKNIGTEHQHYMQSKRRSKISFRMHLPLQPDGEQIARNQVRDRRFSLACERPVIEISLSLFTAQYSVDCSNANNGLFSGIFVMVFTIISLIVFFVLIHSENHRLHDAAITVASLTELTLYSLTSVAVIIGMIQVADITFTFIYVAHAICFIEHCFFRFEPFGTTRPRSSSWTTYFWWLPRPASSSTPAFASSAPSSS